MSTLQVNRIIPLTGSYVYIQGAVIDSASFALTATSASFAISASYATNALTSSFAVSASYATTASYASTVGFNFQQISPSATWTIAHNLNNQYPLVQIYDSNNLTFIPQSINGSSVNTTIVTFSTAVSGYARVV